MNYKLVLLVVLAVVVSAVLGDDQKGDDGRQINVDYWVKKIEEVLQNVGSG
uniref:Uncharacterized protein n=1 Tax=Anopheles albimanus TaxID=7167 RepID=A0A182FWY6_ANOAL